MKKTNNGRNITLLILAFLGLMYVAFMEDKDGNAPSLFRFNFETTNK